MRLTRRHMLARTGLAGAGVAAGVGAGLLDGCAPADVPGTLGGADMARGHRLREKRFPPPSAETETGIAIVGGGIAGLSAAWALADAGYRDFRLLELEDATGGTARSGSNAITAFPLGAHYLPIPNPESTGVLRLLVQLGIVTGVEGGRPVFDPYQVVADPEERLLRLGRWQEGLVPATLAARDRDELAAFFARMAAYRDRRDDGRPAFAIPMALSARTADLLALDRISFAGWLDAQGWRSPVLRAHVRYACRDDYGTEPEAVSAWAGIHYFAARRGTAANVDGDLVLTWPGGNGHVAGRMAARVAEHVARGHIVHHVAPDGGGCIVDAWDVAGRRTVRLRARAAILATPRFVAARLAPGIDAAGFGYAPWVVANVTVARPPAGRGFALAWDNVSATSESLGYVVATHQSLAVTPGPTVLTWYLPLSRMAPADARRLMATRPLGEWQRIVREDLVATNPDLADAIRRIDVWRWGHAMIRPVPGFLWGGARAAAAMPRPPLFFAHSDLSGLPLFEEAHHRGSIAAAAALAHVGHRPSDGDKAWTDAAPI